MKGSNSIKDRVFVLTSVPYRDSDLIVNFLSRESGKMTAVIYGGKKIGKSSSFLFQPGDYIELEYQKSETRDFITVLNSFGLDLMVLDKLPYRRFLFHIYLIEIVSIISKPELQSNELFELLAANINLTWHESTNLPFILWTIWKLIESGGYEIDFSICSQCLKHTWQINQFDHPVFRKQTYQLQEDKGRIICAGCSEFSLPFMQISPSMLKILWLAKRSDTFDQTLESLPQEIVKPLIKILNGYLLKCFEIKPKSLESFIVMIDSSITA
jgi:DNA repair protein RecO